MRPRRPPLRPVFRTGTIAGIRRCGNLMIVLLDTDGGVTLSVPFEHRSFSHLLAAENCEAEALVGRRATSDDGLSLVLLDP